MKGTPLTEETYQYIVENFATSERAMLEPMSARAQAAGIPMIMIGEDQAKFVAFFVRAIKAKRILDVGTLFGYSAATMAKAIGSEGTVLSLEFEPLHAKIARENLDEFGVSNVEIKVGPALDHMKALPDNSFDFILIDADKPNYVHYLHESLRLIRNGGVIAGDNAMAWGKISNPNLSPSDPDYVSATAMQSFNRAFSTNSAIFSCLIPVGDGMAMGVVSK